MPLPRFLARFNRTVANPLVRLVAGRIPPLAIVHHRGRATGHPYSTPVLAFRADDGLVIGAVYGDGSDWVKNVLAADQVDVQRVGKTRGYERPRLIDADAGRGLVPLIVRAGFRVIRVRQLLRVNASPRERP